MRGKTTVQLRINQRLSLPELLELIKLYQEKVMLARFEGKSTRTRDGHILRSLITELRRRHLYATFNEEKTNPRLDTHMIDYHETEKGLIEWENYMKFDKFEACNYRLTEKDEKPLFEFAKKYENNTTLMANELGGRGYKFSARYVFENNAWCFTITTTDDIKHTKNRYLTSWAGTYEEAMCMGLYKVLAVFRDGAWEDSGQNQIWG